MQPLRTRSLSTLRFALAMVVVLASLAAARLQGHMAAGNAFAAGFAALCSGERAPQGENAPAHAHCVLCNLPTADAPVQPLPAVPPCRFSLLRGAFAASAMPAAIALAYFSRGPPHRV